MGKIQFLTIFRYDCCMSIDIDLDGKNHNTILPLKVFSGDTCTLPLRYTHLEGIA